MNKARWGKALAAGLACVLLWLTGCLGEEAPQAHTANTFAMDTLIEQRAWGPAAQDAMRQVNLALAAYDKRLSLFNPEGDIGRINASAGGEGAEVQPETAKLLSRALALSAQSEGAFAISIAPLTLAWGITGEAPRRPTSGELRALLPLVDDTRVEQSGSRVRLPVAGMGLDLGGIAKGAACQLAKEIYENSGVASAWISLGGNVYAHGAGPDGKPFRIGFADPGRPGEARDTGAYIASFELQDAVMAVSGGYERYADIDGERFVHIINPQTGLPVQSDIVSVGVVCADGAEADFWSTTLYVWGKERALAKMGQGLAAILLDGAGRLYVSESLRAGFRLNDDASYEVSYVSGG